MKNWNIISKYLADEASSDEIRKISEWRKSDQRNETEFRRIENIWKKTRFNDKETLVDTDLAWLKVKSRLNEDTGKKPLKIIVLKSFKRWYAIAAIFIALLAISFLLFRSNSMTNSVQYFTAANESIRQDTLPDGTVVILNSQSTLDVAFNQNSKSREVHLKGEAFFDVKHNAKNPFIIYTGNAEIRVLGTSFDVKSISNKTVEVVVSTGKVELSNLSKGLFSGKKEKIVLSAGEKGTINAEKRILHSGKNDNPDYLAWRQRKIIFKETHLIDVAKTLEQTYAISIHFHNTNLESSRLTATFEKQDIDSIMKILEKTFGISIIKSGNEYFVTD